MQPEERDFFRRIRNATTINPFSSDRLLMDLEITGMSADSPTKEILHSLITKVDKILDRFMQRSGTNISKLSHEDLELLQAGMLFRTFHVYCDDFDDHIKEQITKGESPSKVNFADDFFHTLHQYGFSFSDSSRFFSLFFQMRRAYFFISRITGNSACVRNLRNRLWNNIFTYDLELYEKYLWNRLEDFSTMLLGETGTGKGLAASAIGRSGFIPFNTDKNCFNESFAKSFISINLSQYAEQLIESELFGHHKGAFTGAVEAHEGVFARCSPHGAIFIDEIGDVSVPVQIKLLQVLQERTFTPVGSRRVDRFQGRVIGATNKSLDTLRREGNMRDDFYYRLCSDIIEVPSLKQRIDENPDEIRILLSHIVRRILGKNSAELCEHLANHISCNQPASYPWSGNIRELEQCVRRILISNNYAWQAMGKAAKPFSLASQLEQGEITAQQLLGEYCKTLYKKLGTYEAVASITELDRRTVKKYIVQSR